MNPVLDFLSLNWIYILCLLAFPVTRSVYKNILNPFAEHLFFTCSKAIVKRGSYQLDDKFENKYKSVSSSCEYAHRKIDEDRVVRLKNLRRGDFHLLTKDYNTQKPVYVKVTEINEDHFMAEGEDGKEVKVTLLELHGKQTSWEWIKK